MPSTTPGDVICAAADLISDDGENQEYDRALVELIGSILGMDLSHEDTRAAILGILRALKGF